jgi:hypothetical protein
MIRVFTLSRFTTSRKALGVRATQPAVGLNPGRAM